MIFTRTLVALHAELKAQYEVSSTIRHRGEKGRKREHGLAMFLREHLPERYGVATGEIIPYQGSSAAPQCDLIVYDRLTYPIIGKSSAVQQVPYEAVYAVIEVKSKLTSSELTSTQQKFSAMRSLPRCKLRRAPRKPKKRNPAFVLFGYELATTKEKCVEMVKNAAHDDTHLFALDSGFVVTVGGFEDGSRTIFLNTADEPSGVHETLAWFFALFLDVLSEIDLGMPQYSDLLYDGKYDEKV